MTKKSIYERKHDLTASQIKEVIVHLMDDPLLGNCLNGPVTKPGSRYRLLNMAKYWVEDLGAWVNVSNRSKVIIQMTVRKALDEKYGTEWKEALWLI